MFIVYIMNWDFVFSQYLYRMEGTSWLLKDSFLIEIIIHHGGKYLSISIYLLLVLLYVLCQLKKIQLPIRIKNRLSQLFVYQRGLAYLALSTLLAALMVSLLKAITQIDCPWSIAGLGGEEVYQPWLNIIFIRHHGGHCFPAGHASAAYAFFSLYFFSYHFFPKQSVRILLIVLCWGIIFGFAQQLRGAHFISHDISSAFICWLINLFCYRLMLMKY